MKRRSFLKTSGVAAGAASLMPGTVEGITAKSVLAKKRVAMVGTGVRGTSFWGKNLVERYSDILEFVALSDINPGRLELAKKYMGVNCPVFTDFDKMMLEVKPDVLIVTTVDATHHEFIIKGLKAGIQVITEKPLSTDETKCKAILDAEKEAGKQIIVGFNYRWAPHPTKIKELLAEEKVGKITSCDFHWYLNTYHGASYFRRWHGIMAHSGSLWVHKATHHFDLLNWWLDSDPVEVSAYGSLEHYGHNNSFRGANCRNCAYTKDCKFYYDITESKRDFSLYAENEKYDGYIRDNCLWRPEIDIYDKMSAQIKYANGVLVNYSLTTYSPYEGWRVAFNGMNGRIDSTEDIPWEDANMADQASLHAAEMAQDKNEVENFHQVMMMKNFEKDVQIFKIPAPRGGHGGGDERLQDKIFRNQDAPDPFHHAAGSRDGAMSILIGIAARKSIKEGRPIKINELTDLEPMTTRPAYFKGVKF
ncbi:MAG: Gfo/Idh/MocA family oxidoreductase [Saprospiraceae bacterium]|nr:Gfo/Idh/MocA family oxidoreductase [Saprospiraceae bacterium]